MGRTIALEAILANKVKTILTALGIIFGVAAVITMLAIGNGAQQEILEQMKLVGVNNIIIQPVYEDENEDNDTEDENKNNKFSPGLTLNDAKGIKDVFSSVKEVCPQVIQTKTLIRRGKSEKVKVIGTRNNYFALFNKELSEGQYFNEYQVERGLPVCIISEQIKISVFKNQNPIGEDIKCGDIWLKVIGVTRQRQVGKKADNLGLIKDDMVVYTPVQTMILRFVNRSLITKSQIQAENEHDDEVQATTNKNYHQLDKLIVQVHESEQLKPTEEVLTHMLRRLHNGVDDFEIIVPELLLQQQQKTRDIFNMVLGAIAGISLLVGGIGIMNIMLATVMERFKEIGIRMAVGARKKDILTQFVAEASLISLSGGIIGVMLGIISSHFVTTITEIITIVSAWSVFISFGISVAIGILFGYMPARKAASQDPIVSLRSE
ncbi:MAG: ABC transporter permease [Salinivirgaceae bacterium]